MVWPPIAGETANGRTGEAQQRSREDGRHRRDSPPYGLVPILKVDQSLNLKCMAEGEEQRGNDRVRLLQVRWQPYAGTRDGITAPSPIRTRRARKRHLRKQVRRMPNQKSTIQTTDAEGNTERDSAEKKRERERERDREREKERH